MGTRTKNYTHVGAFLRILKTKHREWDVDQAKRLGYSPSALDAVDRGRAMCSADLMCSIIRAYKLEPVEIVRLVQAIMKDRKHSKKQMELNDAE